MVPLFLTHGFVLKLGDFGLASGTYVTEKATFKIGPWSPVEGSDLGTAFPSIAFPDPAQEAGSNYYHLLLAHPLFRELRYEKDNSEASFAQMWNAWHPPHISAPVARFITVLISTRLVFSPAEIKAQRK
jgi:hypothetical protein